MRQLQSKVKDVDCSTLTNVSISFTEDADHHARVFGHHTATDVQVEDGVVYIDRCSPLGDPIYAPRVLEIPVGMITSLTTEPVFGSYNEAPIQHV